MVPVTPMIRSFSAGYPKYAAEINAMAYRVSGTLITVTSLPAVSDTSLDTISTLAPFSIASAAKSCPSKLAPAIQINRQPSVIFRESYTTWPTSRSVLPCIHS